MKKVKSKLKKTASKVRSNSLVQKYVQTETKKKVLPSLAKTGVDLGAAVVGGGLGAAFGWWAAAAGLATIFAGHLAGDKTGLIKTTGVAAMAFGFAKGMENSQKAQEGAVNGISLGSVKQGLKERMIDFKDNLIHAVYLNKLIGSKESSDESMGSLDLDELDVFEDFAERQAYEQAYSEEKRADLIAGTASFDSEDEDDSDDEQYDSYEEIEPELIDFNTL